MIKFIIENKEWIFSGFGVVIIMTIIGKIQKKPKSVLTAGLITIILISIIYFFTEDSINIYYHKPIDQRYIESCNTDNVTINKVVHKKITEYIKGECVYVIFLISGFKRNKPDEVKIKLHAVLKEYRTDIIVDDAPILQITNPSDWLYADSIEPVRNDLIKKHNIPTDGSVILNVKGFVFDEKFFKDELYNLVITATDLLTNKSDSFKITVRLKSTAT